MRIKEVDRLTSRGETERHRRIICGVKFNTCAGVYNPGAEVGLLIQQIKVLPKGCKVLDYGAGSGVLAIAAAKQGCEVVAVDKSEKAIKLAQKNARINKVGPLIDFRVGANLSIIKPGENFNLIIANMPYDSGYCRMPLGPAFYDRGFQMRRAVTLSPPLRQGGRVLTTYSDTAMRRNRFARVHMIRCRKNFVRVNGTRFFLATIRGCGDEL